jgi:hypothetical protein
MKRWVNVPGQCDNCGSDVQVLTDAPQNAIFPYIYQAWGGDLARCVECYCLGFVDADDDDAWIDWQEVPCAKCYRELERYFYIL